MVSPAHTLLVPPIVPGTAGAPLVFTSSDCALDVPQLLPAVTLMVPPVLPAVAVTVLVVDVPLQPLGKVHV